MSDIVKKIQDLIIKSNIEERDAGLIFDLLRSLTEPVLSDIFDLMNRGIVDIEFFQKLWLEKKEVAETGNKELALAIIKKELEILKKINN